MIQEITTHVCRVCKSTHIVKNGNNRCGNAQYYCKDCGTYRVLKPKQASSETEQQIVLRACLERCSLRGIARIFALARQTVARWFRSSAQKLSDVKETLLPLPYLQRFLACLSIHFPDQNASLCRKSNWGDGTHRTLEQYMTPTAWALYTTNTRLFQVR